MNPLILWENKNHSTGHRVAQYSLGDIREEVLLWDPRTKAYIWINTNKPIPEYVYAMARDLDTYRTAYENLSAFQGRKGPGWPGKRG